MIRWTRTTTGFDSGPNAEPVLNTEVLTLCTLDDCGTYVVQVTSGPTPGDDFAGLYYLTGETARVSNQEWTPVAEVTHENAAVVAAVEANFDPAIGSLSRLL